MDSLVMNMLMKQWNANKELDKVLVVVFFF